ncbi:MAG: hypothetical protein ACLP9L_31140 [Thermoguttaceae bacterium]
MGDLHVDEPNTPPVVSPEEMAGRFHGELIGAMPDWKRRLSEDPSRLAELEHVVHDAFNRGADLVVAGLIALVMKQRGFEEACEETRRKYRFPLSRGRTRPLRIRLLGGLLVWVTSLYCAPRSGWFRKRDENVPGLHVELAQFDIGKGCSPALESRVSRQAALCPSLQLAQEELAREGLPMDVKAIARITYQCGRGMLALRTDELIQWREGKLPAGEELAGKRVSVQIDGGRARIRGDLRPATAAAETTDADGLPVENVPGRSKKRPRRTFDAEWREPKLMTIFVHDEYGRMEKQSRAVVDGTFLGPDATAELVAMHLYRLGAARAASITFGGDGAPWIWDRVPTIVRLAKLEKVPIHEVLDCCHAAHHISLALAAMGDNERERMPLYREHRTLLRNGQWRRVVEELNELADLNAELTVEKEKVRTEIEYLRKHGEAGRLRYPMFRRLGLALPRMVMIRMVLSSNLPNLWHPCIPSGCIAPLTWPAIILAEGPSAGAGSESLLLIGLNQVRITGNRGPSFFLGFSKERRLAANTLKPTNLRKACNAAHRSPYKNWCELIIGDTGTAIAQCAGAAKRLSKEATIVGSSGH